MWCSIAKTGALDSQPGDRSTQSDRLELWNTQRHQAESQSCLHEVLVGGHAQNLGGSADGVYLKYSIEGSYVESSDIVSTAGPKEIRGGFGEPKWLSGGKLSQLGLQLVDDARVSALPIPDSGVGTHKGQP